MTYLVVRNWEAFQHYKDRDPPWIKNYTRLLNDDAYLGLSSHRRGLLHGIWLAYALSNGQLRLDVPSIRTRPQLDTKSTTTRPQLDTRSLSARLNMRVTSADLEALSQAGFVRISASKPLATPLAKRKQSASASRGRPGARGETELETETPLTPLKRGGKTSPRENGTSPRQVAAADKRLAGLKAFVERTATEYDDHTLEAELRSRGAHGEQLIQLVDLGARLRRERSR